MALTWVSLFTNQKIQRSDFITQVRTRFDEDSADVISDAQLNSLIDQGLRDIHFRTKLLPEYAETTLDGSASYALPDGMTQLQEVIYINTESTNDYEVLVGTNLEEVSSQGFTDGRPSLYVRNGNNLQIFGYNTTTGTLRVYGSRVPTLPINDDSYIDIPQQYLELLFLWCEWKYWRRSREADEAALSRQLYLDMAEQIRQEVYSEYMRDATFYGKES